MKLKNTLLAVSDMEQATAFYKDVLGLHVIMDFGANKTLSGGLCLQTLETWREFLGTSHISFGGHDGEIYFEEDDFDGFLKRIQPYSIQYVHPVKTHAWGQRVVRFYDPDKHIIEVGEAMKAVCQRLLDAGMTPEQAASIGIIGGADGPTAIFLTSRLAPEYMGAIAICAYSYMALVPVIQPPVMRLLTSSRERLIKMRPPRAVSSTEKILFPIIGFLLTTFVVPDAIPLLGMLFLGNLLKESGVVKRLATTASNQLIDIMTILIGITVGASTQASVFLTPKTLGIFVLGACSFFIATMGGVLFVKLMNLFLKEGNKINPLIGNAGVSAVPAAARVSQDMGIRYDRSNYLLMHAMGPNVAGVVGSAVAAGILLSFLG